MYFGCLTNGLLCLLPSGGRRFSARCDTLAPVDPNDLHVVTTELSEREKVAEFFEEQSKLMFTNDIPRNGLCAFVAGTESEVDQLEVTVTSILEFLPGARVAIAAEDDALDAFRRYVSLFASAATPHLELRQGRETSVAAAGQAWCGCRRPHRRAVGIQAPLVFVLPFADVATLRRESVALALFVGGGEGVPGTQQGSPPAS